MRNSKYQLGSENKNLVIQINAQNKSSIRPDATVLSRLILHPRPSILSLVRSSIHIVYILYTLYTLYIPAPVFLGYVRSILCTKIVVS